MPLSSHRFHYINVIVNAPNSISKQSKAKALAHKLEGCISPRKGFKGSNLGKTSLIPSFSSGALFSSLLLIWSLVLGNTGAHYPPSLGTFWGTLSQVVIGGPLASFVVLHKPTTLLGHTTLRPLLFMVLHTPL